MRNQFVFAVAASLLLGSRLCLADDMSGRVKRAVQQSTLDQPGTKPFHIRASIVPVTVSGELDPDRAGSLEVWWESPERWRREIHTPRFNQLEIVAAGKVWQQNDSDYFPEWLREAAVCLVKPVPMLDQVLARVHDAQSRNLLGSTYLSWVDMRSNGTVSKGIGAGISLAADGTFQSGSGLGWACEASPARDKPTFLEFHGRKVPRKSAAEVTLLEELKPVPSGWFDIPQSTGSALLDTVVVDELQVRRNLLPVSAPVWPPLAQGPLQGVSLASVVLDVQGKIHEVRTVLSDNPGLNDAVRDYVKQMRFEPYLVEGHAVQVVTTITLPFTTVRPAGVESFASARTYIERGQRLGYLASAAQVKPYILSVKFSLRDNAGLMEQGEYIDTWINGSQWRREVSLGTSGYIRTRDGNKYYELGTGATWRFLQVVMHLMEPMPATDTFVESDWRIKRESVGNEDTIRVATGFESSNGVPDAVHFHAFWFDPSGAMVKTYTDGLEVKLSHFLPYEGVSVARQMDVLRNGTLGLRLEVNSIEPAGSVDHGMFVIPGHEWVRRFTDETR